MTKTIVTLGAFCPTSGKDATITATIRVDGIPQEVASIGVEIIDDKTFRVLYWKPGKNYGGSEPIVIDEIPVEKLRISLEEE